MKRKIIYHCGPTNSGKTYEALQRLKQADNGMYCGPLRLLAMEVRHGFVSFFKFLVEVLRSGEVVCCGKTTRAMMQMHAASRAAFVSKTLHDRIRPTVNVRVL
jgi:hypothetical protein